MARQRALPLNRVNRSLIITPSDAVGRCFPTRQDYVDLLVSEGQISSEADLLQRPEEVVEIQRHWHGLGQNGCRFAQLLNHSPLENGWATIVVSGGPEILQPGSLWKQLDGSIHDSFQEPTAQLLSILFPSVTTPNQLNELVTLVTSMKGWSIVELRDDAKGGRRLLSLRVQLPGTDAVAWVLGFGPFEFLPMTRRAPFTELTLMLKPKSSARPHPDLNADPLVAHVADAPLPILRRADYDRMIGGSKRNKRIILDDYNDAAAKAKVSFTVPFDQGT